MYYIALHFDREDLYCRYILDPVKMGSLNSLLENIPYKLLVQNELTGCLRKQVFNERLQF